MSNVLLDKGTSTEGELKSNATPIRLPPTHPPNLSEILCLWKICNSQWPTYRISLRQI